MFMAAGVALLGGPGETDRAHWFFRSAAAGAGDTRNRERDLRVRVRERAFGHGARGLFADGAVARQDRRGDAQHFTLGEIGVGNKSAIEPFRATGHGGDDLGYPAARAGFGGGQH